MYLQVVVFDQFKEVNFKGRFWLKLDVIDLKKVILELVKGVWNGDVDLGDGKLQELREKYESSFNFLSGLFIYNSGREFEVGLQQWIDRLEEDVIFFDSGYKEVVVVYIKKYNNFLIVDEVFKNVNWDVVEYQIFFQQFQILK